MRVSSLRSFAIRQSLVLAITLIAAFGWATMAHAQTSFEKQYGDPMASGQEAINSSTAEAGDSGQVATASSDPAAAIDVLPNTGGSLLPFVGLSALVLGSAGLLVIHRRERR